MQQLVFILGRESHLSVAEIAAVLGDGAEWGRAELSAEALVAPVHPSCHSERSEEPRTSSGWDPSSLALRKMTQEWMARLGGMIKIGEVWRSVTCRKTSEVGAGGETSGVDRKTPDVELAPTAASGELASAVSERMHEAIGRYILDQTTADRKVHFGYSVYDLGGGAARVREVRESLRRGAAAQKAWLAEHRRKVRWVTSREPTLSSVVVQKNGLLPEQNGVEVLALIGANRILFARTLAVQPFEEWGRRDSGRPSRDTRSGMLPPKLARIMINLAIDRSPFTIHHSRFTILDPFCGSGTILTEAMALGVSRIIGTDVSAEAVENAKRNIEWMSQRYSLSEQSESKGPSTSSGTTPSTIVSTCDTRQLSRCVHERVDVIVTEPYLGPSRQLPASSSKLAMELRTLYIDAFREFAKVLTPSGHVVFIIPVFRERGVVLDITRDIAQFGFHRIEPFPAPLRNHAVLRGKEDLPYARTDQRVGRRILAFTFGSPERK